MKSSSMNLWSTTKWSRRQFIIVGAMENHLSLTISVCCHITLAGMQDVHNVTLTYALFRTFINRLIATETTTIDNKVPKIWHFSF